MELSLTKSNSEFDTKKFLIESINKNPKDINLYMELSSILGEEKKYEKALYYLDKALAIHDNDKNILEHKVGILLDCGNHDMAREVVETLLKFNSVSAYTYNNYGFLLSIDGKHKEAIESYKKALSIDSKDTSSMVNIAISYKTLYEYEKAIEMLENAYKLSPTKSIKYLLDSISQNKKDSIFDYGGLVELLAKPDRFHLLIPKSFNIDVTNNVLRISSEDERFSVIISYNKNSYDNKKMENEFRKYMTECKNLYSMIKPLSITERSLYKDRIASGIFTTKINDSYIFNAFGIVGKNDEALIMTITSNIFVSSKLINLASSIISSLYFRS